MGIPLFGCGKKSYKPVDMSQCSGLNSTVDVQVIVTDGRDMDVDKVEYQRPAYFAVCLIIAMTAVSVLLPVVLTSALFGLNEPLGRHVNTPCLDACTMSLVESIPENLTYPAGSPVHLSTYNAWKGLLMVANESIDIASFYWSLRGKDIYEDPSDWQGEDIYQKLLEAGTKRGIKIRIAQSVPQGVSDDADTKDLLNAGAASVRTVNFSRLIGSGILHTKFWVVDGKHFYVGSANMDWRSLTQVKEMGVLVTNCSCLASDLSKIFEAYWYLGTPNSTIPPSWPSVFDTTYNIKTPMQLQLNNANATAFISSSPPEICPHGRAVDINGLLSVIAGAEEFVYIAVMDYFPTTIYTKKPEFWPVIDNALRRAAIDRGVRVRILGSFWNHTRPDMIYYLKSLNDLGSVKHVDVEVKLFQVPATEAQKKIPFGRVNHNKYMVTDKQAYIGTSNWSADYFISTGGVAVIANQTDAGVTSVQAQLRAVFDRDYNATYAHLISEIKPQIKQLKQLYAEL